MTLCEIYETILDISLGYEKASLQEIKNLYELANSYYEKEFGKKCNLKTEKAKLFYWIQEKSRYELLTDCMSDMIYDMLYYDPKKHGNDCKDLTFFLNHFELFQSLIKDFEEEFREPEEEGIPYEEEIPITRITKKQFFEYMEELLLEVDPSKEYLKLFYQALKEKKIIFWKDLNKKEKNYYKKLLGFQEETPILEKASEEDLEEYVVINLFETTEDVTNLMHEFAHYISALDGKKDLLPLLTEYPSIFYEFYAIFYLGRKGYSDDEVNYLLNIRIQDTLVQIESMYPYLRYLSIFLENGQITEELDKKTPFLYGTPDYHHLCDSCTEGILESNPLQSFLYFIGTYLSVREIKKFQNGEDILPRIKKQTENLDDVSLEKLFKKEIRKNKIKVKKKLA